MQQPSSGHDMRVKYQQRDPWASACPPSSLVFVTLAQPPKARETPRPVYGCQGRR